MITPTDQDIELFRALHNSQLGKMLKHYCQRLAASVCDARSNSLPDDVRKETARILKEDLIDRIDLVHERSGTPEQESFE